LSKRNCRIPARALETAVQAAMKAAAVVVVAVRRKNTV
jgi:hypothetical protein